MGGEVKRKRIFENVQIQFVKSWRQTPVVMDKRPLMFSDTGEREEVPNGAEAEVRAQQRPQWC